MLSDNAFQLTARVQGVEVEPAVVTLPSVTAGESTPVTWTVTDEGAIGGRGAVSIGTVN